MSIFSTKSRAGFTLIEIIVAVAIFALVVVVVLEIFLASLNGQRKAFLLQEAQENSRYILESMTKEIRMSTVHQPPSTAEALNLTNGKGENIWYRFDNAGTKKIYRDNQPLSPENAEVTGAFYYLVQAGHFKVTAVMKIKVRGMKPAEDTEINLQTAAAARNFE